MLPLLVYILIPFQGYIYSNPLKSLSYRAGWSTIRKQDIFLIFLHDMICNSLFYSGSHCSALSLLFLSSAEIKLVMNWESSWQIGYHFHRVPNLVLDVT